MNKKSGGFTLIELVVVIAILGIVATVTVPRIIGFTSMAKESVCVANRKTLERMYSVFLVEKDIDHVDSIFNQFIIDDFDEVCPAGGIIRYEDGEVKCSVHEDEDPPEEEAPGEEVPWLEINILYQ
jgi:prepilin-type N-terminal cleavage/methylation domain-containing protein